MFQGILEGAMSKPQLRDTTGAKEAGEAWAMDRVRGAMENTANPKQHASQEKQAKRRQMGNWVSTSDQAGYREPGGPFATQPASSTPSEIDEDQLHDIIMQRFGQRADNEGGFFGGLVSDDLSSLTRALSSSELNPSVASMRSAQAASDSLAASDTTLHSDMQGGASVATDDDTMGLGKASVQGQMEDLMSQDSNLMKQARTSALQGANKRGLLNSSMAVGASQDAMARQALPIAQQDAGHLQTLQQQDEASKDDLNQLYATSLANAWGVQANNVTDIVAQGMEGIANINANPDIKASDKTKMIDDIISMRDADIDFQKQLYGSLDSDLSGLLNNLPIS